MKLNTIARMAVVERFNFKYSNALVKVHIQSLKFRCTCGVILLQLAGFVNILVLLRVSAVVSGQFYNLNSIPKIRGSSSKTQKQERDVVFCVTILRPLSMTTIIC